MRVLIGGLALMLTLSAASVVAAAPQPQPAAVAPAPEPGPEPGAEPVVSAPADDGEYRMDALMVDAIVARVQQNLQQRQDYYWGIAASGAAVFLGIITFVGFGQISDIRKNVREAVLIDLRNELAANSAFQESLGARIRNALLDETQAQTIALRNDMKLVRLGILSERIRANSEITDGDQATLRADLFDLAERQEVVATPAYRVALQYAVDLFYQRSGSAEIDRLDDQLGDVIRANREHLRPMVRMMQYYGLRVLGRMDAVEPSGESVERFLRYANALKANGYFEESAHYLVAWEMQAQSSGWERRIASIWSDVSHFTSQEKSSMYDNVAFCGDVQRLSNNPRPVHYALAAAMAAMTSKYQSEVADLKANYEATAAAATPGS
jgi:hypothetical protein